MDSELKARGVHRRVQRLKARYSPTASYDDIIPTNVTGDPTSDSGDAAASTTPSSTPAAPTSAPTAATSTTPAPATSSTPTAAQPATSSTPAPAPAPASSTTTSSTDSATDATSTTSTSTSSTDPATSTPASQTSTSAPAASTAQTSANTPAQSKDTQTSQAQQHAAASSVTGHLSGSGTATVTNSVAQLPASASASATSTPATTNSTHTGTIVGIVIAVIVGVIGIVFAVTYFMRRSRRDKDDDFSADAFRRQSVMLPDPDAPVVPDRGFAARPPSMIQQRLGQGGPISFDQHPYAGNNGYYGYGEQPSFNPGQVVAMPGQPMPPQAWTPDSSRPFFAPMGESPMGSPVSVAPYDSQYDANGQFVRQPSPGPNEFLNRQPSNGPNQFLERQPSYGAAVELARQPSYGPGTVMPPPPPAGMALDAPDHSRYVDLNRSSVSPFQAEQYAEISHQLNTAPPMPLPTPMVAAAAEEAFIKEDEYVPEVTTPRPLNLPAQPPRSPTDSPFNDAEADDLPRAPSPTFSRKTHVDSMPPMLPQRSFSPVTIDFPMNASPAHAAPSPLATSVAMPSAPAEAYLGNGPASPQDAPHTGIPDNHQAIPRPGNNSASGARPDTVYTMYDDDDVYGGI